MHFLSVCVTATTNELMRK